MYSPVTVIVRLLINGRVFCVLNFLVILTNGIHLKTARPFLAAMVITIDLVEIATTKWHC